MEMQSAQDVAMPWVKYPDPSKLTQEQRELLGRMPINLTRMPCFLKTMGVELDQHPIIWSEVYVDIAK